MKLITENILLEFGFIENRSKKIKNATKVLSRDNIDIAVKEDGFYYSNMGFDYPLKDTSALRKLYKEIKSEDLKQI
ncbi:MAG: hypothetical protein V4580_12605 [Bacteroidota bacterium]